MTSQKSILVVVHSLFSKNDEPVSGTGASLFDLFRQKNIRFLAFHLPIYGGHQVLTDCFTPHGTVIGRGMFMPESFVVRACVEAYIILRAVITLPKGSVYIGIDPLNALWGILGKNIFHKIDSVIYYTADYADIRFGNPILNKIYHTIDRFCISYADQVWNVSTRIRTLRAAQGVPESKNYFVPNSPIISSLPKSEHHRNWITIVGTSTTALNYTVVLDALPDLIKKYPYVRLHIVGELNFPVAVLRQMATWQRKRIIVLHGSFSRERVYKLLLQSGIGLALYTNKDPWTHYGDSMKVREYLAAGLPVIMTDIVSTSDVIKEFQCGKIIDSSVPNFIKAVTLIYSGDYDALRSRSFSAAKHFSYDRLVRQPLSAVGITV